MGIQSYKSQKLLVGLNTRHLDKFTTDHSTTRLSALDARQLLRRYKLTGKSMKIVNAVLLVLLATGCASSYKPDINMPSSSKLSFELLTASGPGGGGLLIGLQNECEATQMISGFRLGHHFVDDLNKLNTIIPINKPVTLKASVSDTILYSCDSAIVFTPEENKNYFATFEYHLPGCNLILYEVSETKERKEIDFRQCE
jgi:hypothetical protein